MDGREECFNFNNGYQLVLPGNNPLKEAFVGGLGDGLHGKLDLLLGLRLGHVVPTNLNHSQC